MICGSKTTGSCVLEEIKARYGTPLAAVHDMGPGILAAVKAVFPGVPDFICQYAEFPIMPSELG